MRAIYGYGKSASGDIVVVTIPAKCYLKAVAPLDLFAVFPELLKYNACVFRVEV